MKTKALPLFLAMALAGGTASFAPGQINPFTPPMDAWDELNQGGTGGPGNPGDILDRARNAQDQANQGFGNSPPPPAGDDPFGGGGFTPPPPPPGGGDPGAGGFGVPTSINQLATGKLSAWGGERIVGHRSGEILQDGRELRIWAWAAQNYFDDGTNGGDAIAGDGIYTNITINDQFISPEAHLVKTKLIQTLGYINDLDPMKFRMVRIATTEPLSPLPQVSQLEAEKDDRLMEWALDFLHDYRINPEEIASEFYPTYLPVPPQAPNMPLPPNFTPKPVPETANQNQEDVDAPDDDVTGTPQGNASSRYF